MFRKEYTQAFIISPFLMGEKPQARSPPHLSWDDGFQKSQIIDVDRRFYIE
jgi:hypothetical protein